MAETAMALFHTQNVGQVADGPIAERFRYLDSLRSAHITRGRQYSELTIPSILPPQGFTEQSELIVPDSSLGAKLVTNIASRITTAAMPAGLPYLRATLDIRHMSDEQIGRLMDDEEENLRVEENLAEVERMVTKSLALNGARAAVHTAVEHLAVTGANVVQRVGGWRNYRLDNFVAVRQPDGKLIEAITRDIIDASYIPDEFNVALTAEDRQNGVPFFQHVVHLPDGTWSYQVQIKDKVQDKETKSFNPLIVARWKPSVNEHYGRSLVEENVGDLRTYESYQTALRDGATLMAQINMLVDPSQPYTRLEDIASAENGEPIAGRGIDVSMLEANKARDLAFVAAAAQDLEQRLGYAFAVNSSVQPTGERVTATQIRNLVGELDAVLGGIYIAITDELIEPMIQLEFEAIKHTMKDLLEDLPVEIRLTTGIEALGREQDKANLMQVAQGLALIDPEGIYLKKDSWISKWLTAHQMDPAGLVNSTEEVNEQRVAQQAQAQAIQSAGTIAENSVTPQG